MTHSVKHLTCVSSEQGDQYKFLEVVDSEGVKHRALTLADGKVGPNADGRMSLLNVKFKVMSTLNSLDIEYRCFVCHMYKLNS